MSSMVQDAYDMGITTSLGGMGKSSLYSDYSSNDYDYDEEEYEEEYEDIEQFLKLNLKTKRGVLHHNEKCAGKEGNLIKIEKEDDFDEFKENNLNGFKIYQCPLCSIYFEDDEETKEPQKNVIPEIDIDDDEIPF